MTILENKTPLHVSLQQLLSGKAMRFFKSANIICMALMLGTSIVLYLIKNSMPFDVVNPNLLLMFLYLTLPHICVATVFFVLRHHAYSKLITHARLRTIGSIKKTRSSVLIFLIILFQTLSVTPLCFYTISEYSPISGFHQFVPELFFPIILCVLFICILARSLLHVVFFRQVHRLCLQEAGENKAFNTAPITALIVLCSINIVLAFLLFFILSLNKALLYFPFLISTFFCSLAELLFLIPCYKTLKASQNGADTAEKH